MGLPFITSMPRGEEVAEKGTYRLHEFCKINYFTYADTGMKGSDRPQLLKKSQMEDPQFALHKCCCGQFPVELVIE